MRRRRLLAGLAAAGVLGATAATANAPGDVGPTQIDKAIQTLDIDAAIRPLDVRSAVQALEVTRTSGATTSVTLSADVLFAFNQATLTRPAQGTIARIAARLRHDAGGRIGVDGYTDSIGTPGYNLDLSRRRAAAVQAALHQALGGGNWTIQAVGHGEADPVAPNTEDGHDNPAGRAQNRRVGITIRRG